MKELHITRAGVLSELKQQLCQDTWVMNNEPVWTPFNNPIALLINVIINPTPYWNVSVSLNADYTQCTIERVIFQHDTRFNEGDVLDLPKWLIDFVKEHRNTYDGLRVMRVGDFRQIVQSDLKRENEERELKYQELKKEHDAKSNSR